MLKGIRCLRKNVRSFWRVYRRYVLGVVYLFLCFVLTVSITSYHTNIVKHVSELHSTALAYSDFNTKLTLGAVNHVIDRVNKLQSDVEGISETSLVNKVLRTVVRIEVDGRILGSGVCVSSREILSATHLISGEKLVVKAVLFDETKTDVLEVVKSDEVKDLLLLRSSKDEFKYWATLGSRIRLNQGVISTGFPSPNFINSVHFVYGNITNVNFMDTLFIHSSPTTFGFSGGGVFDIKTLELVGINSMVLAQRGVPYYSGSLGVNPNAIHRFLFYTRISLEGKAK